MRGLLVLLSSFLWVAAARPMVREIGSKNELDRVLNYHALTGTPVVIDYYSDSCGPCRQIAPRYKQMAGEFKDKAVFLKVNVQTTDAAQGIRSMPTFRFFFRGKQVHEFSGGDPGQIQRTLTTYVNKAKNHNGMKIRDIKTKNELKKLLQDATKMPVLVAFVSKEDEGCKAIWPTVKELNKEYNGKVVLAKVNVDDNKATAEAYGASSVPAFHVYVAGKKIDEVSGPEVESLQNMVIRAHDAHAKREAGSGGGSSSGGKKDKTEKTEVQTAVRKAKRPQRRSPSRIRRAVKEPEKVVILGAGPAGLAAATYAARAGLKPVMIAPDHGGQLTYTKEVENYPGLPDATGEGLIEALRFQAEKFDTQFEATIALSVNLTARPFVIVTNQTDLSEGLNIIHTHTLIIATGANALWLNIPGEAEFRAKGVSTCATCDGFLFKNKPVLVVGGGDSAMEEALFLARIASSVTLVHRREDFRASYILAQRVRKHKNIKIVWNSEVVEFKGTDKLLTHAVVKDRITGETSEIAVDATFVAIGHTPNTELFQGQLGMDEGGFLHTKPGNTYTTVPGVFACGDVADNVYRQAVTSAGTGAMAAIDTERWLDEQGIDVGDNGDALDYSTWSVKELKSAMKERGISTKGCFEKRDFIRELSTTS